MRLPKADRRQITRHDIRLKARMFSEGVRLVDERLSEADPQPSQVAVDGRSEACSVDTADCGAIGIAIKQPGEKSYDEEVLGDTIILEPAEIPAAIFPNAEAKITLTITEEGRAVLSEDGKVIGSGRHDSATSGRPWSEHRLSNGATVNEALFGSSAGIVNMTFSLSCYNYDSGQGCRYCGLFANALEEHRGEMSLGKLKEYGEVQAEAVEAMAGYGWRGVIAFTGGALPPSQRADCLGRIEALMEPLQRRLGSKMDEFNVVFNHYPPEDFKDFEKLRRLGLKATSLDMEVVTPKAFKAVCPGKHAYRPLEYWKEAQEAALDAHLISATNIVTGLEPKEVLLEGIEERLSKGVFAVPLQFMPSPGSPMAKTKAKDPDWILEVAEEVASIYLRYGADIRKPFARAALRAVVRGVTPPRLRGFVPDAWDLPGANAMPMSMMCFAFDELVRRVHEIPGGRFIPLPSIGA